MTIVHSGAFKTEITDFIVDSIDSGTANPAGGTLQILNSAFAVIAELQLSDPAFGPAANGSAVANPISDDTNAVGGTAAHFYFTDKDGTLLISGDVTATGGGGDLEFNTVTIVAGSKVSVTGFTYSGPP